jgi:hypothetical protein
MGGKGAIGLGELNVSESFFFDKLRVRMTERTDDYNRDCVRAGQ